MDERQIIGWKCAKGFGGRIFPFKNQDNKTLPFRQQNQTNPTPSYPVPKEEVRESPLVSLSIY